MTTMTTADQLAEFFGATTEAGRKQFREGRGRTALDTATKALESGTATGERTDPVHESADANPATSTEVKLREGCTGVVLTAAQKRAGLEATEKKLDEDFADALADLAEAWIADDTMGDGDCGKRMREQFVKGRV